MKYIFKYTSGILPGWYKFIFQEQGTEKQYCVKQG